MAAGYVISDVWLSRFNENAVHGAVSFPTNDWVMLLFVNDHTVTDADQDVTALEEASWSGYARKSVNATTWVSQPVAGHIAQELAPAFLQFDNTGGPTETVFGYAILDGSSALVMAESFSGGTDVATGGSFKVKPSLKYKTCR